MNLDQVVSKVQTGFSNLQVGQQYKDAATLNIKLWLTDPMFSDYVPQLNHLIDAGHWDYLLDSFYQVIPFGTGGRRGEVGIGPNRINPWTIQASAQGHSQYLKKMYGDAVMSRGIVITYDVRQFFTNKFFNDSLPNPVKGVNCQDLAKAAARVYAANGVKVYFFDGVRTTPELSFSIRHLNAIAGDMISASHNPPEHNGKKVYDEFGGQLIAPFDENLVNEVTQNVHTITVMDFNEAVTKKLIVMLDHSVDEAYWDTCSKLSLSPERNISIVYSPLNGTGLTSVPKVLERLGFKVNLDPLTAYTSGKFEHITFNIPNPEVIQSFDAPLKYAKEINADIVISSDPDADRVGIMVNHQGNWEFLNGNEIGAVLTEYVISKRKASLKGQGIVIKTQVTTNLIKRIAEQNGMKSIDDLLVGFKFVGAILNDIQKKGEIDNFLMGCEESHGYLAGNYARDKDSVLPAIWLSELAAALKKEGKTIVDYLKQIYAKYGYFRNYLTEVRLPGAEGMSEIAKIQTTLKSNPPKVFGEFELDHVEDWMDRQPIVSETDKAAKNGMVFYVKPVKGTTSMRVTLRPSGTEPKSKMYFEIGSEPFDIKDYDQIKANIEVILQNFEKAFMKECYKAIGVDFPERGFLLFWQLPLKDKLKYFEVESEIELLKEVEPDKSCRLDKLNEMIAFLGADPIEKVDKAFIAKNNMSIREYLDL